MGNDYFLYQRKTLHHKVMPSNRVIIQAIFT
jgi:hypothetical protein